MGREPRVHAIIAGAVLLAGLLGSLVVADVAAASERRHAAETIDQRAELAEAAVNQETRRYIGTLATIAAAVGAYDRLTKEKFLAATLPAARSNFAGATSMLFVVSAQDAEIGAVQSFWRTNGVPDLQFKPQGSGREHFFTVFGQPLNGNAPTTPGVDVAQAAEPTQALNEARRAGTAAVSDSYVLIRDQQLPENERQLSFVIAAPVFERATAEGVRKLRGWVMLGLRGGDFVTGALSEASQGLVGASLWATNGDGREVRVATTNPQRHTDLERTVTIPVAQRSWTLRVAADSHTISGAMPWLPWTAGLAVALFGALLAGLTYALTSSRARAHRQVTDATAELRRAEQEARRQADLLHAIFETINDGVGVIDEHGEFLVHNPAAKRILGIGLDTDNPEEWQGLYGMFRVDGVTPFPLADTPLMLALRGESTDGVAMLIRNAGQPNGVTIDVSGRPFELGGGKLGGVAVFHDVTSDRQHQAELAAFAGIVAHDLMSPLSAMAGFTELTRDALDDAEQTPHVVRARQSLDRVTAGVSRMRRLIDDLLAFVTARDAALRTEPVDLATLFGEVVAERTAHLRVADGPLPDIYVGHLPVVSGDPSMLRHVVDNLIGNAVKYVQPNQPARIDIGAVPGPAGMVRIHVADHGIGIPDDEKPHVFEQFHRAHIGSGYTGTGLGLAICRRVVERHGGTIGVIDNLGGGTRVSFTLPAAPEPAGTAPAGTAPAGTGPAGTGPAGTGPAMNAAPDRLAVAGV